MRQGHHVARPALVVQQQIGVGARHRRMREGARAPCPASPARRSRVPRRTAGRPPPARAKRRRRRRARSPRASGQGISAVVVLGQRRVAVPDTAAPRRRTSAPSACNSDATGADSCRAPLTISASTTSSSTKFARLRDEIGRAKPRQRSSISLSLASVLVISAKMRAFLPSTSPIVVRRLAAHLGVAVGKQVERLGLGQLLPAKRKAQIGDRLVEQPGPGGAAGDRLLVQQLLDLVRQLVRAEGAGVAQPRAVMGERRVGFLRRRARRRRCG